MKIGFIGQGFVGKNIANDFERRGHTVVRYALEPEYCANRDLIAECEIVFVAVPTVVATEVISAFVFEYVNVVPVTAVIMKAPLNTLFAIPTMET